MIEFAFPVVALLFAAFAVLVGTTSHAAFVLREKFPRAWEAEGRPERWLYLNRTTPGNHFFGFLDERRYLATNDAAYARLCTALRIGWRLWLIAFASCFIAFLVAASRQ